MILLVAAMMDEVKEIVPSLNLVEEHPFHTYEGKINSQDVVLVITGIGRVNAASATTYAIMKYQPLINLIINVGIAGGYQVLTHHPYIVNRATYSDFDLTVFKYEFGQVPKMPKWFKLNKEFDEKLTHFHKADIYSGDYFGTKPIVEQPHLVDMESVGIFQVGEIFELPVLSLKVVSDLIGEKHQMDQYKESEINLAGLILETLIHLMEAIK